jgi:hypothetical protein
MRTQEMEISNGTLDTAIEQIRQMQIALRNLRAELVKWKQEPVKLEVPIETESVESPTEKQIQFLKGLGVNDIPPSKDEARRLLQELNEKREAGEYSPPPTAKQLKYLRDLKYPGEMPETKEAAWKLLQELKKD